MLLDLPNRRRFDVTCFPFGRLLLDTHSKPLKGEKLEEAKLKKANGGLSYNDDCTKNVMKRCVTGGFQADRCISCLKVLDLYFW